MVGRTCYSRVQGVHWFCILTQLVLGKMHSALLFENCLLLLDTLVYFVQVMLVWFQLFAVRLYFLLVLLYLILLWNVGLDILQLKLANPLRSLL